MTEQKRADQSILTVNYVKTDVMHPLPLLVLEASI
jgi:hypothetical protein